MKYCAFAFQDNNEIPKKRHLPPPTLISQGGDTFNEEVLSKTMMMSITKTMMLPISTTVHKKPETATNIASSYCLFAYPSKASAVTQTESSGIIRPVVDITSGAVSDIFAAYNLLSEVPLDIALHTSARTTEVNGVKVVTLSSSDNSTDIGMDDESFASSAERRLAARDIGERSNKGPRYPNNTEID